MHINLNLRFATFHVNMISIYLNISFKPIYMRIVKKIKKDDNCPVF